MNNYPTSDLKSGEYETRQLEKRICRNCMNKFLHNGILTMEWRCKIYKNKINLSDSCQYFISEIK